MEWCIGLNLLYPSIFFTFHLSVLLHTAAAFFSHIKKITQAHYKTSANINAPHIPWSPLRKTALNLTFESELNFFYFFTFCFFSTKSLDLFFLSVEITAQPLHKCPEFEI